MTPIGPNCVVIVNTTSAAILNARVRVVAPEPLNLLGARPVNSKTKRQNLTPEKRTRVEASHLLRLSFFSLRQEHLAQLLDQFKVDLYVVKSVHKHFVQRWLEPDLKPLF